MALKRGRVTIEPYTAVWADEFEREHALIQPIFGQYEVYHTGSTSIPGLPSKPIIDMLVGLPSLTDFEKFRCLKDCNFAQFHYLEADTIPLFVVSFRVANQRDGCFDIIHPA